MRMRTRRVFERILSDQYLVKQSTSLVVTGDLASVWSRLEDPQTSVETDPTVLSAGRLGSARGLGEIQTFLHRRESGNKLLSAHEIIEYEPERRALAQGLAYLGHFTRAETAVEPLGEGSVRITLHWWLGFPAGTPVRQVREAERASAEYADSTARAYARFFSVVADE